jgi:hypothetical protein
VNIANRFAGNPAVFDRNYINKSDVKSTTTRKTGGLNFLAAALAAGKKRQNHGWASMLNLHRVCSTRFGQESRRIDRCPLYFPNNRQAIFRPAQSGNGPECRSPQSPKFA